MNKLCPIMLRSHYVAKPLFCEAIMLRSHYAAKPLCCEVTCCEAIMLRSHYVAKPLFRKNKTTQTQGYFSYFSNGIHTSACIVTGPRQWMIQYSRDCVLASLVHPFVPKRAAKLNYLSYKHIFPFVLGTATGRLLHSHPPPFFLWWAFFGGPHPWFSHIDTHILLYFGR